MSRTKIAMSLLLATLVATRCRVQSGGTRGKEDVKIETPFGDMKVKTSDSAAVADAGLAVYPGATIVTKQKKESGSADVDMNFGNFHLRVKAASYHTPDSPDEVEGFYRKELNRYGDVIECKGKVSVGKPSKTREGLGCEESEEHVNRVTNNAEVELKAGSKTHQHIVAIEKDADGTNFGLVALDLPGQLKERESN